MDIESGIEMPKGKGSEKAKYPFAKMEVGESVFFDGGPVSPHFPPYAAAQACGRYYGRKFAGRTVDGGVRIWRTS